MWALSAYNASSAYIVAAPVVDIKGLHADLGAGFGAVYEVALADVDTGMIAGTRDTEDHDIPGAQIVASYLGPCSGLIPAYAGDRDAMSAVTPEHESRTVESAGGGGAAVNIRSSDLSQGRLGDGCPGMPDSLAVLYRVTNTLLGTA